MIFNVKSSFGKRGQAGLYVFYMFMVILIITIAAVMAPLGALFNTEMYVAGEQLMIDANVSASAIVDNDIRESVQGVFGSALSAANNNISVNANIFQYSWVLVVGLTALVLFLQSRRLVEFSGNGFI